MIKYERDPEIYLCVCQSLYRPVKADFEVRDTGDPQPSSYNNKRRVSKVFYKKRSITINKVFWFLIGNRTNLDRIGLEPVLQLKK